jgi:tetratricopeptide (TPR) repeat protein
MDALEENLQPQNICRSAFESIAAKQYDEAEKLLTYHMGKTEDPVALALFHSAMGVAAKMQAKYKEAWRHYDRAEKLLPTDPALKLISARLMIDQFAEYGSAIKRANKVLELIPENRAFAHQAYTIMGLAYAKQGKKAKALEMLRTSIVKEFVGFVTTDNINFSLVEEIARRGWNNALCRQFIETALLRAQEHREAAWMDKLQKILEAMTP